MTPIISCALLALLSLFVVVLVGCAGYQLGPTNGMEAGQKSVLVKPFSNQTMEPRLGDAVTVQMRKELQRDGSFHLASSRGDVVLSGAITHYDREALSFAPNDTLTVRNYRVSLTAHVTAFDSGSGKVIFDRPVVGYVLLRVGSDLTSSERQALPLLAADLAKKVTALLVDGTW
jgi:hypothetical protein